MLILNTHKLNKTFILIGLLFICGCFDNSKLNNARSAAVKSEAEYYKSVTFYKELEHKNKDSAKVNFELGRLYYSHGDFINAIACFKKINSIQARKFLAISYFHLGDFIEANDIFSKLAYLDDESRYCWGKIQEKLNLFDQALANYKLIKEKKFADFAKERINLIEKYVSKSNIKDIDKEVAKIIANAPNQINYPQAGALILLADESIELTTEDTQISQAHYLVKILNERGKENFSEAQIEYDSTDEKVELVYARTIKPDGTVIDVGTRHIRDVSKYLNFPLYSNAKIFIISFPEISEGAVIDYEFKIFKNKLENKKDFVTAYTVQAQEPVIKADFSLTIPRGRAVNFKYLNEKYNSFNAELKPSLSEKLDKKIYSWKFKDIPQIVPESNMPPVAEINPTILISTFKTWQEIYDWWWALSKDKLKSDKDIKVKVLELIKGKKSDEEKAKAIYNFCTQKIRYVAVEYGQAGYEPHQAADIFRNKYGDCKDQAVLLVCMLSEAGINSSLVLIPTKENYNLNEDFPSIMFNHAIAAVHLQGETIFMDPTSEVCTFKDLPASDQGRGVILFNAKGFKLEKTLFSPAEHNLISSSTLMDIKADESIIAERKIFVSGIYEQGQRYWLLYTQPDLIRETIQEKIQEISIGAKLINYEAKGADNLNDKITFNYKFSGPEYFIESGNLRIMPQLAQFDNSIVAKEKRNYPLDLGLLDMKKTVFEIDLPAGFIVKYLPESIQEDSPWLSYNVSYANNRQSIKFNQEIKFKRNIIFQEEYDDFRKFCSSLSKKIKQRVILENHGKEKK